MSKTGKIKTITFKQEWSGPNGKLYFHDVTFENDDTTWNIGSKDKLPSKLAVGTLIAYEVKDEKKKAIKQVKLEDTPVQTPSYQYTGSSNAKIGLIVGAALNNSVLLVAHDKVPLDQLAASARRLTQIALDLEEEFKAK